MKHSIYILMLLASLLFLNTAGLSQKENSSFKTEIPSHVYDILLSRPTDHSISISVLADTNFSGYIAYGLSQNNLTNKSSIRLFKKDHTTLIDLDSLLPSKRYFYQLVFSYDQQTSVKHSETLFFQTNRFKENNYCFTIQADSHLDENTSTDMYLKTLQNMASDSADFMVDLGDTWMVDKYREKYPESIRQYKAQRFYLSNACKSSSLFLTLGNHDGEYFKRSKKEGNNDMGTWATKTRNQYYFNPIPNGFYTGNIEKDEDDHYLSNYYSWEWGKALFIVLDPFRYTSDNRNPWARTLGKKQYDWLKFTLETSKAKFKFVFIHNLVGGLDNAGIARGGSEAAKYFEWGGKGLDGENEFSKYRLGWAEPIHDLLIKNKVSAVFHGHDHFFAKQDLDHLIYQLVPQPGGTKYNTGKSNTEYGYKDGTILNAPGYLRVNVQEESVSVEFVASSIDKQHTNKEVLYKYMIK